MRIVIAAALVLTSSVAIADEVEDAHRLAVSGRDAYWNCLAREYPRDSNKTMSEQDFASLIARVCASERQNFRVSLVDFLSLQFPNEDAGTHLTTANRAIELAQKDIVTAFVKAQGRREIASLAYSAVPIFRDIESGPQARGLSGMNSQSIAGILGAIVAADRAGGRLRLWADRAVRKARQAGRPSQPAAQPTPGRARRRAGR